ncbi:MAG TPA: GNAT family N-acetyltransferase [Mucilaginibacter sp.]|nr:GNAT family N-acetyltransferase [Mucilaginibacter sp.]
MNHVILKRTDSGDADFRSLVLQLDTDLRIRNGDMMDTYDQFNVIEKIDTVVVAYLGGRAAGCGCFKNYDSDTVEVKRMFVLPDARGNGISARILGELEKWAASIGYGVVVLETGSLQVEALGLYQRYGYTRIPNYPPYDELPDSICFRKDLGAISSKS